MGPIYVVTASQGEYSDRREWVVRAFADEDVAIGYIVQMKIRINAAIEEFERWESAYKIEQNCTDGQRQNKLAEFLVDIPGLDLLSITHRDVTLRYTKTELV